MTSEELRRRACDLFDEGGGGDVADFPGDPDDLAAWSMIAQFLETREVVLVPAEFRHEVLRTVRRAKLSRDALLLSVIGFGTGLVLSFVVALALGLDWWPRALAAVQPGTALAFLRARFNESGAALTLLTTLIERGKPFWLSPFMLIWRSGLLILWVALGCAIAALFQPALLRAQNELRTAPGRSVAFGVVWTILFWMLLAACIVLCLIVIGVPLLIVLLAFNLALGAFGMTLTFSIVGEWIARRLNHPHASLYAAVFAGACFLGLLRLIPVVGSLIWFVAGLFGIGATLAARFGISAHPPQSPSALSV